MQIVDPAEIAKKYLLQLKGSVARLGKNMHVVGFIASDDQPSLSYANATRKVFTDVGFNYDLRRVKRLELEIEIIKANKDKEVEELSSSDSVLVRREIVEQNKKLQLDVHNLVKGISYFYLFLNNIVTS